MLKRIVLYGLTLTFSCGGIAMETVDCKNFGVPSLMEIAGEKVFFMHAQVDKNLTQIEIPSVPQEIILFLQERAGEFVRKKQETEKVLQIFNCFFEGDDFGGIFWDDDELENPNVCCDFDYSPTCDFSSVEYARLKNQNLKYISLPLDKLGSLTSLDLSQNDLTAIPIDITFLTSLKKLVMTMNQIQSLPKRFACLSNLTELDLGRNQLTTFPIEISALTSLEELKLNHNKIDSIPKQIKELINIEEITLNHNIIKELPDEFGSLPKLKRVMIEHNMIQRLPKSLWGKEFTWFSADHNNFDEGSMLIMRSLQGVDIFWISLF